MPNNRKTLHRVYIKAILCSLIGVVIFLTPLSIDGNWTVLLGVVSNKLTNLIGDNMALFTLPIFILGAVISLLYYCAPSCILGKLPARNHFTASHWVWVLLSTIGGINALLLAFNIGPEWLLSKETGLTAYVQVAGAIFIIIGLGCLFLPFLTDYGLLEFIGVLFRRPFKRIFHLPGRAAIDVLASWVGASSIAVLMTSFQYERGFYSAREAAIIATNFSVVSLPFVWIICQVAGIETYFFPFYGSMALVCISCAMILPKVPPLSQIPNQYYPKEGKQLREEIGANQSALAWALNCAEAAAVKSPTPLQSLRRGFISMVDIFTMMMPAAMTIEFIALVIFYHTPILNWLSAPFIPLLNLLSIPQAEQAAPGVIVGLLDQFVPAIVAGGLDAPVTRFVLAGLSVTQLIFFAESALLIMRSKIPLSCRNWSPFFLSEQQLRYRF